MLLKHGIFTTFLRGIHMVENMTVEQFIECAILYNNENDITLNIKKATECPAHVYASMHNKSCKSVNSGTKICSLCNRFMCNICGSHQVSVVSRVTGYLSTVSDPYGNGWNEGKKDEFKQRQRVNIK